MSATLATLPTLAAKVDGHPGTSPLPPEAPPAPIRPEDADEFDVFELILRRKEHADAACSDDHLVTLVASRAPASSPGAPLHTIVLRCDDP